MKEEMNSLSSLSAMASITNDASWEIRIGCLSPSELLKAVRASLSLNRFSYLFEKEMIALYIP